MNKEIVLQSLTKTGIIPVVRADSERNIRLVVEALLEENIPIAEITMTIPNALEIIAECSEAFGRDLILGAGTVTDATTCKKAIDVGSRFVVTPIVEKDTIAFCKQEGICVIGGALTPTEILTVWESGADAVKVFPAAAVGGPRYIRMIHEPFPHIPLVPSGGINLETISEYFQAGAAFVGAGGDLINKEAVEAGNMDLIRDRCRQYVSKLSIALSETPYS